MNLLDTNVVSELRKTRPHGGVLAWFRSVAEADLLISAVTVGEIQAGIERVRQQDFKKAAELEAWLDLIERTYQVLPMDAVVFRTWARLQKGQRTQFFEDAMIAATALVHGLTVVTRNVRDFAPFDVAVLDPFAHPSN